MFGLFFSCRCFYSAAMKRQAMLCVLLIGFSSLISPVRAQESPAAAAERQEAEERHKRLTADIEDLKTAVQSCQQRLNEQREEIRKLGEEIARAANSKEVATREDFKHLADKLREVDEKRIADNEKMMEKVREEFARLGKVLDHDSAKTQSNPKPPQPKVENGYEYIIAQGDTVSGIISKLRQTKQGLKLTQKQIIDANPNVNWNKLRIGQKIFIPATAPL